MTRLLLVAAIAFAAAFLSSCSDGCDCPLRGEVDVQVSASFGTYDLTLGGPACGTDGEKHQNDAWRWTVVFFHEGNCQITIKPKSGVGTVSRNFDAVRTTDTDQCCPNGLVVTPPQSGPIQFTPPGH